tara:strand:- start:907 stop:1155 length:249 start_codon:yes stop_codon:yes gene_type:complete
MPTYTRRINIRHATNGRVVTFDMTDDTLAGDIAVRVMGEEFVALDWTLHLENPELILAADQTIASQTAVGKTEFDIVLEPQI